ncbi:MAG: acylneuraminate cytidylyltransferase family protein [Candidatus Aminicenantes bacterium]|nr:acylneuraminate cytidylyltransferase family protein [Candidatus Aminicenantes bacterium]
MKDDKEILALIPARSGSKRLPGKNKKMLWGKPLLAYSIETALRSKLINRVICTTDSQEIADIALEYGAEVPFLRPGELSGDKSADTEFYLHALDWLANNEGYKPDIVTNLRPTNPLRIPELVDDILGTLILRPDVDSIRTVSRVSNSVFKMRIINRETNLIENVVSIPREGPYNVAKQSLPETFLLNTYLDATWVKVVLEKQLSLGEKMLPYILDETPVDIDTKEDWQRLIKTCSSYEAYLNQKTGKK